MTRWPHGHNEWARVLRIVPRLIYGKDVTQWPAWVDHVLYPIAKRLAWRDWQRINRWKEGKA